MPPELELEVFRAGDYGAKGAYSEDDLQQIAQDYDPKIHEAPVTLDHQQEGPALGWVQSLRAMGKTLLARLSGLDGGFLEKVKAGAFKKRSIELYPAMQETQRPYLRAVSFLGAASPAVKGLADPLFSENTEACCIAFDEKQNSTDPPDPVVPPVPETLRFCEDLRQKGRLLPAWENNGLAAFIDSLNTTPSVNELSQRVWFLSFLEGLGPLVPLGESAPGHSVTHTSTPVPLPEHWHGARFDEDSLDLHHRATQYCQTHPASTYAEALKALC
jgi:hypothetical protein